MALQQPLYLKIAGALQLQIQRGVFRVGERMPSVRQLRAERGVSASTAVAALAELEARGLVAARPRSGYFVSPPVPTLPVPVARRHRVAPRQVPARRMAQDVLALAGVKQVVPMGAATLAPELLPLKQLARIAKMVLGDPVRALGTYGAAAGEPELQRQLAKYSARRGLTVAPEEIVVTAGCMDSIRLAVCAVAEKGDTIALESPSFYGFLHLARELGLRVVELPADPEHGVAPEVLDRACASHAIKAVVLTPSFQNPTGALMSAERRIAVVEVAKKHGITIIEDDVYGDLHFSERRLLPLASNAECDVIYCSSLSKSVSPGLRIGWILPFRHLERVRRLKFCDGLRSPVFNQLVAAEFLGSGNLERHLRHLRMGLEAQVGQARAAVQRHFPVGTQMTTPQGGFLLWLKLPNGQNGMSLSDAMARHRIALLPGELCSSTGQYKEFIRLSCGHPWVDRFERALKRMGQAVTSG